MALLVSCTGKQNLSNNVNFKLTAMEFQKGGYCDLYRTPNSVERVTNVTVYCGQMLHKGGLFTRHPERCVPLEVGYWWHRLEWCKEHKNWTSHHWSRVLYTDGSCFSATSDSQL
ncbi:transposable element Tcb2 transposase [Trichonephila clavipes]|nr:transposable element Tcb2 transposase [Trichonephila clavipes]